MTPPKPSPLACAKCGQPVPATARNYAFVMCADCIPPQFQPSRRRLTQAEPYCVLCGVRESLNPVEDHENWTGHPWRPTTDPTRRRLTMPEWEAELARARTDVKPLRTRTGRRRSWWQRGWKR